MKMPSRFLLFLVVSVLCIAGLRITANSAGTGVVAPANRFSIEQSRYSGQWKGPDLSVAYKYSRDQGQMDLTGDVRFIDAFRLGFTVLDEFRLSAVFLDENGRVLESKGLLTNRGSLDDIPFHVTLRPPSSAVSMAFSYAGKAHEGGRDSGAGSLTSFWFDPVNLPGS